MLRKVAVVTDSVACLTREQVEQNSIGIVPLNINYEGKNYRDWVDITPTEAYKLFLKNPDAFTTSTPSPADFLNAYREAGKQADNVLCITLSSKLSTTYNAACMAKEYAIKEFPQMAIEVMDSLTATAAEGLIVLAAARAANIGESFEKVKSVAKQVADKVNVYVILDTIKHVYRSGRVPKIASQAGSLLSIKPMFNVARRVNLCGLVRSQEKGIEQMIEKVRTKVGTAPLHIAIMHAYAPEAAQKLKERVVRELNCEELWMTEFSPLMGYACGTGTLGLAFYPES
jgi:DegV family protein with EDD domain